MVYVLIFIIGCLFIKLNRTIKQRNIYYNNYKQCLMVLSESDPELKKHLEGKDEKII